MALHKVCNPPRLQTSFFYKTTVNIQLVGPDNFCGGVAKKI